LWNSGFKKQSYYKSQASKPGMEMEIFLSFSVADPDILKRILGTRHNRNKTKPRKSSINKKAKQTLTKRFFCNMRQQSTKYQWRIEKPLKFTGRFGYGRKK
jgi:hypothetical protein